MLRLTWVLLAEAIVLATLSALLFARPVDAGTARLVAGVLAALAVFVTVMMLGQRTLLSPFAKRVGICDLCAKR